MYADLILFSNAIFDSVGDVPFAGGVAVSGKKIQAVGSRKEIEPLIGPDTKVLELGDRLVMPGFIDSHGHFGSGAEFYSEVACHDLESCRSEEECAKMMGDFAAAHPDLEYYTGKGWYLSYWGADAPMPTAASLDRYIPDKPVFLTASDLHSLWMNTKGMEVVGLKEIAAGLSEEYALRDENGQLTGVIREKAMAVNDRIAEIYKKTPEEEKKLCKEQQLSLLKALNQAGITGFSDVSFIEPPELAAVYSTIKEIENDGDLTVRIYVYPGTEHQCAPLSDIKPYEAFFNTDELHITGVKGILDGVTATFTAYMLEDYSDKPGCRGIPTENQETMDAWVAEANRLGYSCRIHCIGDAAVRSALDAYEKSEAGRKNKKIRNAIEHIEVINPADIPRFGELGVIASMQPRHQILDKAEKLLRCGKERSRYEWAFRSIMDHGGKIAMGTDYPVSDFNVYENMYFGITTRDLDGTQYGTLSRNEVFTLAEAIKSYTAVGAYINGMEEKLGTLSPGKYADITVADRNLFAIGEDEIKDCRSVLTVFNGKIVYEEEDL